MQASFKCRYLGWALQVCRVSRAWMMDHINVWVRITLGLRWLGVRCGSKHDSNRYASLIVSWDDQGSTPRIEQASSAVRVCMRACANVLTILYAYLWFNDSMFAWICMRECALSKYQGKLYTSHCFIQTSTMKFPLCWTSSKGVVMCDATNR